MQIQYLGKIVKLADLVSQARALYIAMFISLAVIGVLLSKIYIYSQIIPIWIPAGIALIGCYLWWWRFFPAVFIASFTINCSIDPNFQLTDIFSVTGIQNGIIATGALIQAAVGSALLRYWLGNPVNEWNNRKTVYFIFLVGIFTNLISASIGTYTLNAFKPPYNLVNSYWIHMIYWWLSDSLGVLLTAPFLLSLFNYKKLNDQQRKVRIIIICSASVLFIIISLLTWFFLLASNVDTEKLVKKEIKVIENSVYRQLNNSIHQLQELAKYVQDNTAISRDDFEYYVSQQIALSPSLKAMSWNPMINYSEISTHEARLKKIHSKSIPITGKQLEANDPIVYIELISPEKDNDKAIGFNVFSDTSRKETLLAVLTDYQPKATPIIQLIQSDKPRPAFLLFLPVLEHTVSDIGVKTTQVKGFVTGVFYAKNILSLAIDEQQRKLFFYEFSEIGKNSSFSSNTKTTLLTLQNNPDHASQNFLFAGKTWRITLDANKAYILKQQNRSFLTLFLLQVTIVTIIMMLLLMMNNQQRVLDSLVNKRTKSLKHALSDAKKANKAKSQFLANVSHEIRTPMNSVIGFAKLAEQSEDISEIKSYLSRINVSSDLLLDIVNDILDISKIESQKLELNYEIFDIHESMQRITTVFESTAKNKNLSWKTNDAIPENLYFNGDQTRLEQILMNLCSNAIKFTQQGRVTLGAALLEQVEGQAQLAFTVQDSGIGIAESNTDKVFQPFIQEDASTSRNYGGTGLGLTIAKKLSSLMQGDIAVSSEVGVGSTFTFTCKLKTTNQKPQVLLQDDSKSDDSQGIGHLKVLVAEDNHVNQILIVSILKKLGIKADVVENGQLALDKIQQKRYDVILMDCQMPVLDGYEATRIIRSMPAYEQLPIIALTADVDSRSKERAFAVGFTQHLAKPIDITQLKQCLSVL